MKHLRWTEKTTIDNKEFDVDICQDQISDNLFIYTAWIEGIRGCVVQCEKREDIGIELAKQYNVIEILNSRS